MTVFSFQKLSIFVMYLQVNLELFSHPYPSLYLLHYTVFSLVLWVRDELKQNLSDLSGAFLHCITISGLSFVSASVGLSFLQFTNMNSMRNLIITGLSLFLGISVPQFFNEFWTASRHGLVHTHAGWVRRCPIHVLPCLIKKTTCRFHYDLVCYIYIYNKCCVLWYDSSTHSWIPYSRLHQQLV